MPVAGYEQCMRASLSILTVLLLVSACTTSRMDGSPKIQTTGEANRENIEGAVSSPLRDLNAIKTIIPDVLQTAAKDPYARPVTVTCATLSALILPLNGALGADYDEIGKDEDDLVNRGHGAVLGAVASAASSAIPLRGWVRQLSGAAKHDQRVTEAITAGAVRRAYLKGLGESLRCYPPATPTRAHPLAALAGGPVESPRARATPKPPPAKTTPRRSVAAPRKSAGTLRTGPQ